MSRSRRKTPFTGIVSAPTEKQFKQLSSRVVDHAKLAD
jgi:hypothetical protein